MYTFLDRVDEKDLRVFLQKICSSEHSQRIKSLDRSEIYSALFSLYGFDILYEKRIRRLMFLALSKTELTELSKELGLNRYRKIFDLALSISNVPWRVGASIIWRFAELFSVPIEYLPARERQNDSIEVIEPFVPPPSLFDYQEELASEILNLLRSGKNKACLLQLPTGAGKTKTMMEAITKYLNLNESTDRPVGILWLAHTEELCEQAIESFRRVWQAKGNYEIRMARFWGDYKVPLEQMSGGIIVGGYQKTFILFKNSPHDFKKLKDLLSIVIVDEAHKALAPTIKSLLSAIRESNGVCLLGLTATPGRGKEARLENLRLAKMFDKRLIYPKHLGDNLFEELQRRGVLSQIRCISKATNISCSLSDEERKLAEFASDIPSTVLNRLARNVSRNELILSIVLEQIQQGNPTLVFACTVQHAKELAVAVAMRGHKAAAIDCRMRRNLRRRAINAFRKSEIDVLFNFGVLSTGFDAPNIKTVVIARPTSSIVLYSQMIGRGLRGVTVGGTEECNLIDIKDNFDNFGDVDKVYSHFNRYWSS